ncbi:MAG: Hsp20/alpha crystallin family protein [Chitinophagales bacterium]
MKTFNVKPWSNTTPHFSNLIENIFSNDLPTMFNNEWYRTSPLVNIKETSKDYTIEMAIPGFSKENFTLKVEENTLTISAVTQEEKQTEGEKYTRKEFQYQAFTRNFALPKKIDATQIAAAYENGILKVTLPKPEDEKPKGAVEISIA